jgi:type II secretory pathway pseudopilin PulG
MFEVLRRGVAWTGGSMSIGRQHGYTYLGLLAFVAISGAAMAALGQHWATAIQREKEHELIFRGEQIRRAVESYHSAPGVPAAWPPSLDALLMDGRGPSVLHHLRRNYADPFTGRTDWILIGADDSGRAFVGVRSRSQVAALRTAGVPGGASQATCVCDWRFEALGAPEAK